MRHRAVVALIVLSVIMSATGVSAELEIIEKPLWVFPGQIFRIVLRQPAGSGVPEVQHPANVEMFDQWDQDERQRFYFRALEPGATPVSFAGEAGELTVDVSVIPWSEIYEPREYRGVQLPRLWPMGEELAQIKPGRTIYTEDEIAAMQKAGGSPGSIAREWVEMTDQEVWDIIPGPAIPRTCLMVLSVEPDRGVGKGCPVCGEAIYEGRSGFYPWIFDPEEHPWKVGCPECGSWFPSNDWHEGDMHSGPFPDDGWGCEPVEPVLSPSGTPYRWPFIAYYHQWEAYMNTLTPGILQAAEAYVRSGDEAYAHKCAVALARFAQAHLDMSLNLNHRKHAMRDGVYVGPAGAPRDDLIGKLGGSFSYIQPNWDTPRMENAARAYDLIYPAIADDAELIAFLQSQHHPEIQTAEDVHRFLQAGIIRTCAQYGLDNAVSRNWPMQERMVATMALAQGTPRAIDLVDHLLNGWPGLRYALTNEYLKDGAGHETGGYNSIQIRHMAGLADLFSRIKNRLPELYQPPQFISIADDPQFRQMFDMPLHNSLIARTFPMIGDTSGSVTTDPWPLRQGYPLSEADFANIYAYTRDPIFARAAWGPSESVPDSVTDPEIAAEIERIGREQGWRLKLPSEMLDGYGHAILRSGEGDAERAVWIRYGAAVQHRHHDMLTWGLEALTRKMLPELGYPQGWTYAGVWESNWGTHYMTHITGVSEASWHIGGLHTFAASKPAQVARVRSAAGGNEDVALRERVCALVDFDARDCYTVTLERVRGGSEHTWSFHGPSGPTTVEGAQLTPQGGGTVAGPQIEYKNMQHSPSGDAALRCLNFMPNPNVGEITAPWQIDYTLEGQDDVHLTVSNLTPGDGRLWTSVCRAPGGRSEYEATWCVVQRSGTEPFVSEFLQVLEPWQGERRVESIEALPVEGGADGDFRSLALRVTGDAFVDTIIIQPEGGTQCTAGGITTDAEFALWRQNPDGELLDTVLVRGTVLRREGMAMTLAQAELTGRIESCDWPARTVRVMLDDPPNQQTRMTAPADGGMAQVAMAGMSATDASALVGRHVLITNEVGNRASHMIEAAEPIEGGVELTLDCDPRVAEGPVQSVADGQVTSGMVFRLDRYGYYTGKTVANEDGSAAYRFTHMDGRRTPLIATELDGEAPTAVLEQQFTDRDGDGIARMIVYDYGPGDSVTIPCWATLRRDG